MGEEEIKNAGYHPADTDGDGSVSKKEHEMFLEFKRKELEDADARRDAMRKMTWFCLLYTSPSPRDRQKSRMPSSA